MNIDQWQSIVEDMIVYNGTALSVRHRPSFPMLWMSIAHVLATRATCPKKQVGAICVSDEQQIIAVGWNGALPGQPHCTEVGCLLGPSGECIRSNHAEVNCLHYAGREAKGSTLYLTLSPCYSCAKLIARAEVGKVVYQKEWQSWKHQGTPNPLELLAQNGVKIDSIYSYW